MNNFFCIFMFKMRVSYAALFKSKIALLTVHNEETLSNLIAASYSFMPNERYDFDKNGNRKQAEIQGQKQQYKTAEYNRLISDNESEYKYDLEGNRISKISKDGSIIKYHWDNRNRLAKVETPNGSIEYIYDHQNRIVLRKQGETKTTFIHDGWQIVLQFDNNKPTHRYLWGTKQDELICDNDNWTLGDHLNTIRDIVKSDGTVTDHLEYNSFGKIISATKNDSSLQFAYTGKLTDKESDLQWNINRWYDAKVGRWMSEDPIGFWGGDENLYRYVHGNIIHLVDYTGQYENCTIKIHVGHGPEGAEKTATTIKDEGTLGSVGFGRVSAIACSRGTSTGNTDINLHLKDLGYKVPSGLPELPTVLMDFPLVTGKPGINVELVLSQQYAGTEGAGAIVKKPSPIGSMTQMHVDSLWPADGRFDPSIAINDRIQAYNEAVATVFKAYMQAIYQEGLSMSSHPHCASVGKGKVTITFLFKNSGGISRANFIKGVWNKNEVGWTDVTAGVNYIHTMEGGGFSINELKIVVDRHGTGGNPPPPVLTHAIW
jgi:RHS repeat-associated protein